MEGGVSLSRLKSNDRADTKWIYKHIEAAVKGAVYRHFRNLFNNKVIESTNNALHSALMVFIHQFAFSGMFKYDKEENFSTSYGEYRYNEQREFKEMLELEKLTIIIG